MSTSRLILAVVLVLAASMLVVQAVSALGVQQQQGVMPGIQGRGPGMHRGMGEGMMMNVDQLKQALNLTPDQVSKIQSIQANARTQRQAIVGNTSLSPQDKRSQLMQLRQNTHQQVMAVLTPDQQAKLKQLHQQRKAERFDKMSAALGLTPDQQTQIKAIRDKERTDLKAVKDNASLSAVDRSTQIKQIRSAARDQIRALLTPEQKAKLDAMHRGKAGRAGAGPRLLQPKAAQPRRVPAY